MLGKEAVVDWSLSYFLWMRCSILCFSANLLGKLKLWSLRHLPGWVRECLPINLFDSFNSGIDNFRVTKSVIYCNVYHGVKLKLVNQRRKTDGQIIRKRAEKAAYILHRSSQSRKWSVKISVKKWTSSLFNSNVNALFKYVRVFVGIYGTSWFDSIIGEAHIAPSLLMRFPTYSF